jgi:hypothetical protein
MTFPDLVAAKPILPSDLELTYSDGSRRRFSCAPYLDRGVFVRLRDASVFSQAHVAAGTVCWPGGLDIAPETLFLRSSVVSQPDAVAN